jgi:hypothetical protein
MRTLGDVLVKLAVSKDRLRVSQTRSGRRPLSVTTYLRKETEGTLYKKASPVDGIDSKVEDMSGVRLSEVLNRQKLPSTLLDKAREGLSELKGAIQAKYAGDALPGGKADNKTPSDFDAAALKDGAKHEKEHTSSPALAREIAMDHLTEDPQYYKKLEAVEKRASTVEQIVKEHQARLEKEAAVGAYENKLPWYTTAGAGALGHAMGGKLLKKAPLAGALLGTMAGTAAGLEGGTAIGKKLDARQVSKLANSGGTMQRLPLGGAARGPEQTNELLEPIGVQARGRRRPGDVPSDDTVPSVPPLSGVNEQTSKSVDLAMKVSSIGRLVPRGDTHPTAEDVGRGDPMLDHIRERSGHQQAGGTTPVSGYNPNVDDKQVAKLSSEAPYTLTAQEWEKVSTLYLQTISHFDGEKLASVDIEELHKEALMGAIRKVIPQSKKLINLGDEVVDLRPKSNLNYKGLGKKLEETGNMFRAPKGVTPEMAQAAGNMRAGSISGRVFGEGLHSAGHHMGHASTVGKAMNPIGKPLGGFIEGVTAQSGRELQRAGGAVATGLKGPAATLGGGFRGAVGRGLEKNAPKVGLAGEIATAAGTGTALGHAVSPAAAGLAGLAKATGTYAPLKGAMGSLGFNVAKDVAATGAEGVAQHGARLVAQGAKGFQGIASKVPGALRFGRGVAEAAA